MIQLKNIKKKAKKTLKHNYWRSIAILFFISILIGQVSFKINFNPSELKEIPFFNSINSDIARETFEKITNIKTNIVNYKPERGILANVFNNITSSGNFIFGLLNSFNQLIFHERIWGSLLILLGAILSFIYWMLIRNVLIVGESRFFLENRNYKKTNFNRILMPYKVKKTRNVSFCMMKVTLKEWIWYPTIIGGFIKHYEYALVPYILAENPGINSKTAIELSKSMMFGNKLTLFKLDLSLLGWSILDFLTFHLVGIFFASPYKTCCKAEIYMEIRKIKKQENLKNIDLLNDSYLEMTADKYPIENYTYKESETRKWLNTDYNKDYSLTSLILLFFSAAIIGYLWEVGFHLFRYGSFVNRGTLHGPWLPIYGWGLVILLILLKKTRKHPILTFTLSCIICGVIEYITAWYLETFKHARWWDYDGYFLNIQGRICLEGLLAFGIGGILFIYFAAPILDNLYKKIPENIKVLLCITLLIGFLFDNIYTNKHPNTGEGISNALKTKNTMINSLST